METGVMNLPTLKIIPGGQTGAHGAALDWTTRRVVFMAMGEPMLNYDAVMTAMLTGGMT